KVMSRNRPIKKATAMMMTLAKLVIHPIWLISPAYAAASSFCRLLLDTIRSFLDGFAHYITRTCLRKTRPLEWEKGLPCFACPLKSGIGKDAEIQNAKHAQSQRHLGRPADRYAYCLVLRAIQVDVLDDSQVVVEADEGVEHADQRQPPEVGIDGSFE